MPDFTLNYDDPVLREKVSELSTKIAALCKGQDLNTIYNSLMTVTVDVAVATKSHDVAACFVAMCHDMVNKKPKMDA